LAHRDYYDAFVEYQSRLLAQFEAIAEEYEFCRIDATRSIREVFQTLKDEISEVIADMVPLPPQAAESKLADAMAEVNAGKSKK
jgi:hypothetical protein